jgi:hypothetical protein
MLLLPTGCLYNNTPMVFYGKVVDQNNAPVVGADVLVSEDRAPLIQLVMVPWWEGNAIQLIQYHMKTDKDGKYTATGLGLSMSTVVSAPGYSNSPTHPLFHEYDYSDRSYPTPPYVAHADHPVVWTLWKLAGPEPLISGGDDLIFIADGKPHGVDLLDNRKAPDAGRADFWITMPPPQAEAWYKPFSWSYEIKVDDGGVIETDDDYPFTAPVDGYIPNYSQSFRNVKANFRYPTKIYYLKCRNGQIYARIEIEWEPTSTPSGSFRVSYVANPGGSRNLEPGLEKKLPPGSAGRD